MVGNIACQVPKIKHSTSVGNIEIDKMVLQRSPDKLQNVLTASAQFLVEDVELLTNVVFTILYEE